MGEGKGGGKGEERGKGTGEGGREGGGGFAADALRLQQRWVLRPSYPGRSSSAMLSFPSLMQLQHKALLRN